MTMKVGCLLFITCFMLTDAYSSYRSNITPEDDAKIVSVMSTLEYSLKVIKKEDRTSDIITLKKCSSRQQLRSCYLAKHNKQRLQQLSNKFLKKNRRKNKPNLFNRFRGKRSTNSSQTEISRVKRGIPGNPCAADLPLQMTILYAIDVRTANIVELFQDPINEVYQTFFAYDCILQSFYSFPCVEQFVEYMAVVYFGNNNSLQNRPVKIPTNCGIKVG
ncbi:uncharacterized protein LOC143447422 [Clavelina lepadiformis]|uniref:uncharacterized protein LOC143447422 n=1 Tax=Clavelina lepadiformis TaxID=159417 RepID=UPI004041E7C9